jgi:hypothetical protein
LAHASASSRSRGIAGREGTSRIASVSCTAVLLGGGGLGPQLRTAAEESVYDGACVEQIGKCAKGLRGPILARGGRLISDSSRGPIGPIARNERASTVGQHHKQQLNAATTHAAHDLQNAALKRVPLADDRYRTRKVAETGSVWWLPSIRFRTTTSSNRWLAASRMVPCCG